MKKPLFIVILLLFVAWFCNFFTPWKGILLLFVLLLMIKKRSLYLCFSLMPEYGYRGTCYVNSQYLYGPKNMSLAQIRELHNNYNWEIGGHSLRHENLAELTYEEAEYTISQDYWVFIFGVLIPVLLLCREENALWNIILF
jgi:hypothetical protein